MHQAAKRGIKVLMDLVVNHTSDEHPWFQQARAARTRRIRDWYVWSKKRPKHWNKGMVFPGVQDRTWTFDRKRAGVLLPPLLRFPAGPEHGQPDVRREILRIMGYWLQLGVHGFRVDAVPFVIESTEPGPARGRKAVRVPRGVPPLPAVAPRRRDPARRGERAAGGEREVLRRERRRAST
jgi:maltose alpha-D-glucosyltransferase / alpha-amylase